MSPLPEELTLLPADSVCLHLVLDVVGCAAGCDTHQTDILIESTGECDAQHVLGYFLGYQPS